MFEINSFDSTPSVYFEVAQHFWWKPFILWELLTWYIKRLLGFQNYDKIITFNVQASNIIV